jgi:hypothetical protein
MRVKAGRAQERKTNQYSRWVSVINNEVVVVFT